MARHTVERTDSDPAARGLTGRGWRLRTCVLVSLAIVVLGAGPVLFMTALALHFLEPMQPGYWDERREALLEFASQVEPTIDAIRAYSDVNRAPPESLVPRYLDAVPDVEFRGNPLQYTAYDPQRDTWAPDGVTWSLWIDCSIGILNFDTFFYWPTEEYPTFGYSGRIEPMGSWAYVHE